MKVKLNKVFEIDASVENTWTFLQNIQGVASCMPGAQITGQIDNKNYKGKVRAKIGPVTMSFNGDIKILTIDTNKKTLHFIGIGQETKGTSAAEMDLTATVRIGDSDNTQLVGNAIVTVSGKLANFGGRMMAQVADQILDQFGKNFASNVIATEGEGPKVQKAIKEIGDQPKNINVISLAWSVFIGFLKSIFTKK